MDIFFAWLLRALSRFIRSRSPAVADRIGLGSERADKLSNKTTDLIGRTGLVETELEGGKGRVSVDGISWAAEGEDAPAGCSVRVIGIDGNRLKVQKTRV